MLIIIILILFCICLSLITIAGYFYYNKSKSSENNIKDDIYVNPEEEEKKTFIELPTDIQKIFFDNIQKILLITDNSIIKTKCLFLKKEYNKFDKNITNTLNSLRDIYDKKIQVFGFKKLALDENKDEFINIVNMIKNKEIINTVNLDYNDITTIYGFVHTNGPTYLFVMKNNDVHMLLDLDPNM